MKYRITIEKIDVRPVKSREWVEVDPYKNEDGETKHFDYRDKVVEEEVSETIYQQTVEGALNLSGIINAVNVPFKAQSIKNDKPL